MCVGVCRWPTQHCWSDPPPSVCSTTTTKHAHHPNTTRTKPKRTCIAAAAAAQRCDDSSCGMETEMRDLFKDEHVKYQHVNDHFKDQPGRSLASSHITATPSCSWAAGLKQPTCKTIRDSREKERERETLCFLASVSK